MRKLLFLLVIALNSINGFASSDYNQYWQKANKFYEQKEYDSAAHYYEQIAKQRPDKAVIYYNLGNTYYRLNLIGPAVLNYERALRIDPSYKEANDNLWLTQSRIPNRIQGVPEIFFVRWWHGLTHGNKAGVWAFISLGLFLAVIGIRFAKNFGKLETLPGQVTVILSVLWALCIVFAFTSARNKASGSKAVVMKQDAPFLLDHKNNKPQSLVPEGTTVKYGTEQGDWVEIRLPDGRSGWMSKSDLAKI